MKQKIFIIAGEPSGDQHAADLVKHIWQINPNVEINGIGGDNLQQIGVNLMYHLSEFAVLGIGEVIKHLPFIFKAQKAIQEELKKAYTTVILVDYPGFNLRIARMAKKMGLKVIYYISPQLWAWGEKRVKKIRQYVDLMLVLFQFEVDFYRKHGIKAKFVGHPLIDQIQLRLSEEAFRKQYGIPAERPIIGIFPGSRKMEVENLLPVMLEGARKVAAQHDFQVVISKAAQLPNALFAPFIQDRDLIVVEGDSHHLMKYSHVAVVASGTATLEMGILQTPMVVVYKVAPLTYWLGKMLIKVKNIALVNIVAGQQIVPELIQHQVTADNIAAELENFIADEAKYRQTKAQLTAIKPKLGSAGASAKAAQEILSFLQIQ